MAFDLTQSHFLNHELISGISVFFSCSVGGRVAIKLGMRHYLMAVELFLLWAL